MDEQEQLYLSFIKQDIQLIPHIDDPGQQAHAILTIIKQLCILSDEQLLGNLRLFNEEQQRINKDKQVLQDKMMQLIDEERKNLKNIYDDVLCKL